MHKKTKKRLILLLGWLALTFVGIALILYNLRQNITFFYPPSKLVEPSSNREYRVGGIVKAGSVVKISPGEIKFTITDGIKDLNISYKGILPALFREEQGAVAKGRLISPDLFIATELLTKHDENYKPPELED